MTKLELVDDGMVRGGLSFYAKQRERFLVSLCPWSPDKKRTAQMSFSVGAGKIIPCADSQRGALLMTGEGVTEAERRGSANRKLGSVVVAG